MTGGSYFFPFFWRLAPRLWLSNALQKGLRAPADGQGRAAAPSPRGRPPAPPSGVTPPLRGPGLPGEPREGPQGPAARG